MKEKELSLLNGKKDLSLLKWHIIQNHLPFKKPNKADSHINWQRQNSHSIQLAHTARLPDSHGEEKRSTYQ